MAESADLFQSTAIGFRIDAVASGGPPRSGEQANLIVVKERGTREAELPSETGDGIGFHPRDKGEGNQIGTPPGRVMPEPLPVGSSNLLDAVRMES